MIRPLGLKLKQFFKTGHVRTISAKKNIAISLFLKGISIVIGLMIVPMTISYVNPTQYGVWLTLSSIVTWFGFFDIGLGNGLKNKLAEANALNQYTNSKAYVSTTYAVLSIIAICLFCVFLIINHFISWTAILNTPVNNKIHFNNLALIVFGFFCIQFILQILNIVLTACHEPSKVSMINVTGQLLSLLSIFLLIKTTTGSLIYLMLAMAGVPLVIQLIASIYLYGTKYKLFSPSLKLVDLKYAKSLLNVGIVFFVLQIGALILFQTDNIVITQLFGPKDVTLFNVAYKLFSVITMIFTIVLTPFWSAFTDAYTKGDLDWIRTMLKKMNRLLVLFVFLALAILIVSPFIYKIWLHGSVIIPWSLSLAMTLNVIVSCWQMIYIFFINGIGKVRLQLYLVVFTSLVNIPMAIFLGKKIGLAGITFANIILYIIIGISMFIQTNRILNNKAEGIFNK